MVTEYMEVPEAMRTWMELVAGNLEQYICHGIPVPKPPATNNLGSRPKNRAKVRRAR